MTTPFFNRISLAVTDSTSFASTGGRVEKTAAVAENDAGTDPATWPAPERSPSRAGMVGGEAELMGGIPGLLQIDGPVAAVLVELGAPDLV
jgi:hypothetical protein